MKEPARRDCFSWMGEDENGNATIKKRGAAPAPKPTPKPPAPKPSARKK